LTAETQEEPVALKKWLARVSGIKEDTLDRAWHRDRGRDDLLASGLAGTATIVEQRGFPSTDDDEIELLKRDEHMLFLLEIAVSDGRAPYQLQGAWKIPGFYKGWDWVQHVEAGMQVPVKVKADDPERVAIDWEAFVAAGGREIVAEAERKYLAERQAGAVVAGTEAVDSYLDKQVAKGKMSQTDADQQRHVSAMTQSGQLDDMPPANASPRQMLEWQLSKGLMDQATYDSIIAANPNL